MNNNADAVQWLRSIAEEVENNPSRWAAFSIARDSKHEVVSPWSKRAVCWSAEGFMCRDNKEDLKKVFPGSVSATELYLNSSTEFVQWFRSTAELLENCDIREQTQPGAIRAFLPKENQMKNIIAAVNAIPALDAINSGLVSGDQLDLGEVLGIPKGDGEFYWDHRITRAELLESALKHGKEPDALALRRHLGNIARSLGSDDQADATWVDVEGKAWEIEARQYDVSDTHCIRSIYADETGETDHELIELADCETLGEWLESTAMVNGELNLNQLTALERACEQPNLERPKSADDNEDASTRMG